MKKLAFLAIILMVATSGFGATKTVLVEDFDSSG
jgi:hypothetical protein